MLSRFLAIALHEAFARGTPEEITDLLALAREMRPTEKLSDDPWSRRGEFFLGAVIEGMVAIRDEDHVTIAVESLRGYYDLKKVIELYEICVSRKSPAFQNAAETLYDYLRSLPNYQPGKLQMDLTNEQHGLVSMVALMLPFRFLREHRPAGTESAVTGSGISESMLKRMAKRAVKLASDGKLAAATLAEAQGTIAELVGARSFHAALQAVAPKAGKLIAKPVTA
jgi:hypothetical protein